MGIQRRCTVSASATAEAYNPSGHPPELAAPPRCSGGDHVRKALAAAQIDPSVRLRTANLRSRKRCDPGSRPSSAFRRPSSTADGTSLHAACNGGDCSLGLSPPLPWQYYPADFSQGNIHSSPAPPQSRALEVADSHSISSTSPVACKLPSPAMQKTSSLTSMVILTRDPDTAWAVDNCLTHTAGAAGSGNPPPRRQRGSN